MDWSFLKELPDLLKNYAGAITAVAAAVGVITAFRIKTREKRLNKQRKNLGITALEDTVKSIAQEMRELHEKTAANIEQVATKMTQLDNAQDQKIDAQFQRLEEFMADSEKERLRDKIYEAADRARRGEYISGEYYSRIRDILHKYEDLGGDGAAHSEWDFFMDYYNKQMAASSQGK